VNELEFLSAHPTSPAWRSPLLRALANAPVGIRDVSGEIDAGVVAGLAPAAGVAGIELHGPQAPQLLRRLTEITLDVLPAIGPVAHVRTLIVAADSERLQLWFPQEYADYMAACVLDAATGIGWA
jgi:hypothetical protein